MEFGVAGIPNNCKSCSSLEALKYIKNIGLDSMELEFVRGVKMREETAIQIKRASEDCGVLISSHAPYYINLLSRDKNIVERSKKHILDSLRITDLAGGYVTAIHSGYMQHLLGAEENYKIIKEIYEELDQERKDMGIKCKMGPESRGKIKGFGDMNQLLRLMEEVDVLAIFDIAHLHATREFNFINKEEFYRFFKNVEHLEKLHIHFSEIDYGDSGEKSHLNLETKNEPNYKYFLEVAKELGVEMNIILETPDLENSALKMKNYYLKIV